MLQKKLQIEYHTGLLITFFTSFKKGGGIIHIKFFQLEKRDRKICTQEKNPEGFTLLEVVIALGILVLLVGIVFFAVRPGTVQNKTEDLIRAKDTESLADAVRLTQLKEGRYPFTFPFKTEGWAIGGDGGQPAIFVYYDGTNWTVDDIPEHLYEPWSTTYTAWDIDINSPVDVWVSTQFGGIFHWDGDDWEADRPNGVSWHNLLAIDTLSPTKGWVSAGNFTILENTGTEWVIVFDQYDLVTQLVSGGMSQEDVDKRCDLGVPKACGPILDLHMFSESNGWAIGSKGIILHYNGVSWNVDPVTYTLDEDETLEEIRMISTSEGFAVGRNVILKFDGISWQKETGTGINGFFHALSVVKMDDVWIAGGDGKIYHYDGVVYTEVEDISPYQLLEIFMENENRGWGVDDAGKIWDFDKNRAEQWKVHTNTGLPIALRSIYTVSTNESWVSMLVEDDGDGNDMRTGCADNNENCDFGVSHDTFCIDASPLVTSGYLSEVPVSPPGIVQWDKGNEPGMNGTGYTVQKQGPNIVIRACEAEHLETIEVIN